MVLKSDGFDRREYYRTDPAHELSPVSPLARPHFYMWCQAVVGWPLALLLLVLAAPVIGLMAAIVRLTSRGPAFYSHMRQGRNGRPYRIYKIRTMVQNSERHSGPRWATPNDPRITWIGRILRKTHLDELPQLFNVLRGDMCLVGPRPERPEIAQRLEGLLPHYRERVLVRPGLTGLAQVHLPADTDLDSVRRKLAHDLYYIQRMGPWLDLRLLICTGLYLFRIPFHLSARFLRVPGRRQVEHRFPALWADTGAFQPHLDFAAGLAASPASAETVVAFAEQDTDWTGVSDLDELEHQPAAVSIVVPCCNEEASLDQLWSALTSVQRNLGREYDLHWLFVDDGSSDGTWQALKERFGEWSNATLLQHERNRGVAAAIRTGIAHARTEIVCSIDADCTYDPHELARMIPLLRHDVALVTASPYHAEGLVLNVPRWRLTLSRGASFIYRQTLRNKLCTYTSCFRVYRRSAVQGVETCAEGFEGITELLARLDLQGHRIAEYPTTLSSRRLGVSKLRVLRATWGHLRLMSRLWTLRLRGGAPGAANSSRASVNPISLERTPA